MNRSLILVLLTVVFLGSTAAGQTMADQQSNSQIASQGDTTSGWQVVYSNPTFGIGGLQFPTKDTGYVGAYDGSRLYLLRSTNSGANWDTLSTTPPQGIMTFVTGTIGYCNYYDNSSKRWVYKTTDGGNSWTPFEIKSMLVGGGESPIAFIDADTGMIFGFSKNARTTDGGKTWTEVNSAIGLMPNAGCFGDSQTGYAVGALTPYPEHLDWPDAGYCEKSTDGGLSWKQIYTGIPHEIVCCDAISASLIIVGGNAFVARSTDGGGQLGRS